MSDATRPVLVLLDCQQYHARAGGDSARSVVSEARRLLVRARNSGWDVLHSRMRVSKDQALDDAAPIEMLKPLTSEPVFSRRALSAYSEPAFAQALDHLAGPVFLAGFSASFSVLATVFDARARGHALTIIPEAVGGMPVGPRSAATVRDVALDVIAQLTDTTRSQDVLRTASTPGADQLSREIGLE